MYLEIPADPRSLLEEAVQFPLGATQVWLPGFWAQELNDPRIVGTRFHDSALFQTELAEQIVARAASQPRNRLGEGGKKVRDAVTWDLPAARLLSLRAMLMACHLGRVNSVHVLDRWANVMEAGDYSRPHCHYDAEIAAVYCLDYGERRSEDLYDGAFELIDPRIPYCCPYGPERPIRGMVPGMEPGTLILFPATFLHYVRLYHGRRPRLTLAWNISPGPPPADRVIDPTKQVRPVYGQA